MRQVNVAICGFGRIGQQIVDSNYDLDNEYDQNISKSPIVETVSRYQ